MNHFCEHISASNIQTAKHCLWCKIDIRLFLCLLQGGMIQNDKSHSIKQQCSSGTGQDGWYGIYVANQCYFSINDILL